MEKVWLKLILRADQVGLVIYSFLFLYAPPPQWGQIEFFYAGAFNILKSKFLGLSIIVLCFNVLLCS